MTRPPGMILLYLYVTRIGHHCYILINVDDIIIIGNSNLSIEHLISKLHQQFCFKDLGPLSFFVVLKFLIPLNGGLSLSQSKYVSNLV